MGITVGPVDWWIATPDGINSLAIGCPVGTVLPDSSRIICKAGGVAWIVAPVTTEVFQTWNGTTNTQVGNKCCVCDWSTLCSALISAGFNPGDWFVPSISQLQNPGFVCRTNWDVNTYTGGYANGFWSSTELNSTCGCGDFYGNGGFGYLQKTYSLRVRAFRCVTY